MKAQDQKAMLLEMAGNVTNEEVANINPKFQELISLISGRTLEQLAKEIASKKSAIKDELKGIPGRIDSVRDAMPESEDWAVLEKEIADKKEKIKDIDSQLADKSKQIEAEFKAKSELQKQIGNKKLAKSQRENEIRQNANKSYHDVLDNISKLEYQVKSKDAEISRKQEDHSRIKATIEALNNDLEVLRGKFYAIDAETLQYPEGAFICPTCKRELEVEDIQAKQQELQDNFNLNKANRLKAVQNEGKEKAAKVEELKKQCSIIQAAITQLSNEKEILVHNINECKGNMPEEQDTQKIILSDPTWLSLSNEIVDLENQLKAEAKPIDTTELKEAKAILSEAIDELNKKLGKRDTIERSNKVIEDLEDRRDKNNEALAEQERLEFLVQDFQKEKDNKLMERINGMFSLVKFSFISEKLNGNEAITCFCSVDGVPFADVNNASKINAGLDIINAICRSVGITAPIFIDNRESVNDLIPTMSQVINLVVSKDKSFDDTCCRKWNNGRIQTTLNNNFMTQENSSGTQVVSTQSTKMPAQAKKIDVLKTMLNAPSVMEQFKNALSKNASTFVASIIDLYNSDSNLQLCEPKAVVAECLKAAVLKLPINKALGYAFIIPFNNSKKVDDLDEKGKPKIGSDGKPIQKYIKVMEPTFQLGYKGYIQLAERSNQYRTINADVVFDGEVRKVNKLTGEIAFDGEKKSDKIIGYFCYFELLNGFSKTLYMTVEQMATHAKRYSKGLKKETTVESLMKLAELPFSADSKTVGWLGNFHGMAIKTVIRNLLSKYGYLSIEMQQAFENDVEGAEEHTDAMPTMGTQRFDVSDVSFEEVSNTSANTATASNENKPGF